MLKSNATAARASYIEPMVELVESEEQKVICTSASGTLPGGTEEDWGTI